MEYIDFRLCRGKIMAVLLCSFVYFHAAETLAISVGDMPADKVLFLGNSLTDHPPNPGIGWYGDWGMDASSQANDYAHLTTNYIATLNGGASPAIMAENIVFYGGFEQNFATHNAAAELSSLVAWNPDIVVFQLGDNSTALVNTPADEAAFASGFADVLAQFSGKHKFVVSTFWPSATMDSILQQACADAGGTYVNIDDVYANPANQGGWGGHPNNAGMAAISAHLQQSMITSTFPPADAANVVSIDFENLPASSYSVTQTGQGAFTAPGDMWNSVSPAVDPTHAYYGDILANYGTINSGVIVDSVGNQTGITITATATTGAVYSWDGIYNPGLTVASCTSHPAVMNDWLIDQSQNSEVTISGLIAGAGYDMALYGHSHEFEGNTEFTVWGDTRSTGYATAYHTLTEDTDYMAYNNVIANESGEIVINFVEGDGIHHGGFNGFQIKASDGVDPPIEEPVPPVPPPFLVSDTNLLSGMSAAGTNYEPDWLPETVTDGKAVVDGGVQSDWVAPSWDTNPRLAVWGLDSDMNHILIWGAGDLDPNEVEIKSSTSLITPTTGAFAEDLANSYETTLVEMTSLDGGEWIPNGMAGDQPWQMYCIPFNVDVPEGTQSLLFDFGTSGRTRIVEVQGFWMTPGDANGDGSVDVTDLGILATNYGASGSFGWGDGDFTGDGLVNVSDLGILATYYGTSAANSVPEPAVWTLLLAGLIVSTFRMRKR